MGLDLVKELREEYRGVLVMHRRYTLQKSLTEVQKKDMEVIKHKVLVIEKLADLYEVDLL